MKLLNFIETPCDESRSRFALVLIRVLFAATLVGGTYALTKRADQQNERASQLSLV